MSCSIEDPFIQWEDRVIGEGQIQILEGGRDEGGRKIQIGVKSGAIDEFIPIEHSLGIAAIPMV